MAGMGTEYAFSGWESDRSPQFKVKRQIGKDGLLNRPGFRGGRLVLVRPRLNEPGLKTQRIFCRNLECVQATTATKGDGVPLA
jgi:hypothetical protein